MKVLTRASQVLFILCLPVLLLTASVSGAVNCKGLYQYGFEKYDIENVTGLTQSELNKAADGLIEYFNSGEENISLEVVKDGEAFELFNEREVVHLKDVKGLFRLVYYLLLGTLVFSLVYTGVSLFWWRDKRRLLWGLVCGGCLTLVLMLALGLGTLFNFDQLFLQFHLFSFANDLWMLDPATDYLIMLFPSGFWYDAALFCVLLTTVGAVILGGIGWWRLRKSKNEEL